MQRIQIALAMVAMLLIGLTAGAVLTRSASAENSNVTLNGSLRLDGLHSTIPATTNLNLGGTLKLDGLQALKGTDIHYQIIPLQRLTAEDPVAARLNVISGATTLIYSDGKTKMF